MEKNKVDLKISVVINIIIFLLTVTASIMMFTGFKFMETEPLLESTKIGMLRFFTVDSNLMVGIVALIFAIKEIQLIKGKIKEISKKMLVLKMTASTAVGLTFVTVFAYLGPISPGGIPSMLKNSNLFLHLIIPVLSMLVFALYERTNKINFRYTLFGILPTVIYAIGYVINILVHIENGKVSPIYDWYWFVQGGLWQIVIVLPLMIFVTYIICVILWRINKKSEN